MSSNIVVQFNNDFTVPYDRTVGDFLKKSPAVPWSELSAAYPGIEIGPLFFSSSPENISRLESRARRFDRDAKPRPSLLKFYLISVPTDTDIEPILRRLRAARVIDLTYRQPMPGPPPAVTPDDQFFGDQKYLQDVGAAVAWALNGGDGAGQELVIIERGWKLGHEDLPTPTLLSGTNSRSQYGLHGNQVLGVIAALDNTPGIIGIAPSVKSIGLVSQIRNNGLDQVADAICSAAIPMAPGSVLLIEAQSYRVPNDANTLSPVEIDPGVFTAIQTATMAGIIVIEPAGNGTQDLGLCKNALNTQIFAAGAPSSGAIIVGAANDVQSCRFNYGSRVDLFAHGLNVLTTGPPPNSYPGNFGGTSSASAIIAGVALVVQGIVQRRMNRRFSPAEILQALRFGGTPYSGTKAMGVRPNLAKIINQYFPS